MKVCLIIDGGKDIKATVEACLSETGFEFEQTDTCDDALALCKNSMPDVIVLDSDTPSMSGLEFLSRLRQTRRGQKPVVLYCAAEQDTARIGQAIWRGASECLVKPFDTELLTFKLHQSGVV